MTTLETIEPTSNAAALTQSLMEEVDDRRLLAGVRFDNRYRGDLGAAVRLARTAFEAYDPRRHKLSTEGGDWRQPNEIGLPEFFRLVAFDEFRACRNIWAAGQVLLLMIAEATAA